MKTSIKLLLAAFIFVVVLLIIGNAMASREYKKVATEQQNGQVDSIPEGTQSISIKFSTE